MPIRSAPLFSLSVADTLHWALPSQLACHPASLLPELRLRAWAFTVTVYHKVYKTCVLCFSGTKPHSIPLPVSGLLATPSEVPPWASVTAAKWAHGLPVRFSSICKHLTPAIYTLRSGERCFIQRITPVFPWYYSSKVPIYVPLYLSFFFLSLRKSTE